MNRFVGLVVMLVALCGASPAFAQAESAANRAVGRAGAAVGKLRTELEAARLAKDIVRINCLNDKLVQAEVAERSATEKRASLRGSTYDDPESEKQALATLEVLAARADALVIEARQCVGEQADNVVVAGSTFRNVRFRDVEKKTEALKEQVQREKTRISLVSETVLASPAAATPAATPAAQPAAPTPPPAASPYAREGAHDNSMLIRTADLTLAVFEVEKNLDAVEAAAREAGGYLASKSDRQITIRIPRERFDDAVKRIEKLGDVLHRNIAAEDVTDQYVDLDMRLKNALAVRERLEKLLAQATVKDAIEIQKELAKTTEEIERLQGKMKLLRDRIGFSTITVTFERSQPKSAVQQRALLPFPWMNTMGLGPLLTVQR
jgi:hypothetical protein